MVAFDWKRILEIWFEFYEEVTQFIQLFTTSFSTLINHVLSEFGISVPDFIQGFIDSWLILTPLDLLTSQLGTILVIGIFAYFVRSALDLFS